MCLRANYESHLRSIEELKTAITVILEKEMNHRLKGYLVE